MRRIKWALGTCFGALALAAPAAAATDYAETALNIIPSGQKGGIVEALQPQTSTQAHMYDNLTPLFDQVTPADLASGAYFKSEMLGVGPDGPAVNEPVPRAGVTIVRDRFLVPHVTGVTHDDGIWAAGWIAAEDRSLLMEIARYNGRVAALDVPGITALSLINGGKQFIPSASTEAELARQTQVLEAAGPEGLALLHDIDVFIQGINDYLDRYSPTTTPWTRNDVYALNAVKGQFLGQGGGDEVARAQFLAGLQERLGQKKGRQVFDDLRQFKNPELPTTIDGRFPYGSTPKKAKGSVVIDPGSFTATPGVASRPLIEAAKAEAKTQASNTLMITADHSKTGKPLMVGGPQIGYLYPGFTYEIDMNAGDLQWRGATSVPFPGYLLIGRGEDFANTLTSASGDIIDQYAEKLCGDDHHYTYKGECLEMEHVVAGTIGTDTVEFWRTVHGPVVGYATADGERVAISSKRSSYGQDILDQLFFRRLSNGQVSSPKSFFKAAALTPQTFNSFYIDSEHVAEYTSGKLPIRAKTVDPSLPTLGTGKHEWRGFLSAAKHPHGIDPEDGTMTNWNQSVALGFGAADDEWGRNGSVARADLLDRNLARLANKGKWTLASVTSAMNAAGTQDVRAIDTVPLLRRLLADSKAPSLQANLMLDLLVSWREAGGSRLDRDLDGKIDHPGAAIMDVAWPLIADAVMRPRLGDQLGELSSLMGKFDLPPGGQYNGWYQYFDKDIRSLLDRPVKGPYNVAYCGKGKLSACQKAVWAAIEQARSQLTDSQGTPDPSAWHSDAVRERIEFSPGLLQTTMRYTNRPSGIQQVISFSGHR